MGTSLRTGALVRWEKQLKWENLRWKLRGSISAPQATQLEVVCEGLHLAH